MGIFSYINQIVEVIGQSIDYIGLSIVVWAVITALFRVVQPRYTMEHVRRDLARRIIFGLEFVIAADIILATVLSEWEQILQLGGIVCIRVVLGYALRKEARLL